MHPGRLLFAAALFAIAPPSLARTPDLAAVEKQVVELTNEFRAAEGLAAVAPERHLQEAAREFARFMAASDQYGHTADGREPAERAKAEGYDYCLVSENISYQYSSVGFGTAELARRYVEGWKNSPGHRKNMVDEAATHTGVSVAHSPKTRRYYAVQMFGRPRSQSVQFQVRNAAGMPVRYRVGDEEFPLAARETATHRRCRSAPVSVVPGRGAPIEPGNGERLEVVREAGGVALRREGGARR